MTLNQTSLEKRRCRIDSIKGSNSKITITFVVDLETACGGELVTLLNALLETAGLVFLYELIKPVILGKAVYANSYHKIGLRYRHGTINHNPIAIQYDVV